MKSIKFLFFFLFLATVLSVEVKLDVDWEKYLGQHDLVWSFSEDWHTFPDKWYDAPFTGNGNLGMYMMFLYESEKNGLRINIGRADGWDNRPKGSKYNVHNPELDKCRINFGHFFIIPVGVFKGGYMRQHLYTATVTGTLVTSAGTISFKHRVDSNNHIMIFDFTATDDERDFKITYVPETTPMARGSDEYVPNPDPYCNTTQYNGREYQVCSYDMLAGGDMAVGYTVDETDHGKTLYATIDNSIPFGIQRSVAAKDNVYKALDALIHKDEQEMYKAHTEWWSNFYKKSFLSIPDTKLESFYWIQLYKYASASRCEGEDNCWPYDLMGPWWAPTGWSDYHFDLNVQMAAWPLFASNHHELLDSFILFHKKNQEAFKLTVPEEYRDDSGAVGTETGWDFQTDTNSWGTHSGMIVPSEDTVMGNLVWDAQILYLQYRYTNNITLLEDTVYPILRMATNYYLRVLEKGDDGKYHTPLGMSPEYASDTDTNWDIANFKWGCKTLLHITKDILKNNDPYIPKWEDAYNNMVDYPRDEDGLLIGHSVKLTSMHRHWSHLFAIYPYHLLDTYNSEGEMELITKSINHFISFEPFWNGFGIVSSGILSSMVPEQDDYAYGFVDIFWRMSNFGKATMYYESSEWPVNESPLGLAAMLQYFIIRSDLDSYIHIFPIHASRMDYVSMYNTQAEGGFSISGVMRGNSTEWLSIESQFGNPLVIRVDDLTDLEYQPASIPVTQKDKGIYSIDLKAGETIYLYHKGTTPDFTVSPYPAKPEDCHAWGKH